MSIEVMILTSDDELNRELYRFYRMHDSSTFVLDAFYIQSRKTKRHHFKSSKVWSRLDKRSNNIERPVIRECVIKKATDIIISEIKFEQTA